MKKLLIFALYIMVPVLVVGQDNYGFGMLVSRNFSNDEFSSKTIYISKVVNLDSIVKYQKSSKSKGSFRKNHIYSKCLDKWFVMTINEIYPDSLGPNSEILFMNQVEVHADFPSVKPKHLNELHSKANRHKKSVFMNRDVAENKKRNFLRSAYKDKVGKVVLVN